MKPNLVKAAPWLVVLGHVPAVELVAPADIPAAEFAVMPSAVWKVKQFELIMMHATPDLPHHPGWFRHRRGGGLDRHGGGSRCSTGPCTRCWRGLQLIPKVPSKPVLVWFGIGTVPAILTIAFLISFFPVVVNVATGLATLGTFRAGGTCCARWRARLDISPVRSWFCRGPCPTSSRP